MRKWQARKKCSTRWRKLQRDSLELYRSLVESETCEGVFYDADGKAVVEDWNAKLKRWYSILARSGREIGDIPELRMIEL